MSLLRRGGGRTNKLPLDEKNAGVTHNGTTSPPTTTTLNSISSLTSNSNSNSSTGTGTRTKRVIGNNGTWRRAGVILMLLIIGIFSLSKVVLVLPKMGIVYDDSTSSNDHNKDNSQNTVVTGGGGGGVLLRDVPTVVHLGLDGDGIHQLRTTTIVEEKKTMTSNSHHSSHLSIQQQQEQQEQQPNSTNNPWWFEKYVDEYNDQECVPMQQWQIPHFSPSSCNRFHEIDLLLPNVQLQFINCGGSRCAFRITTTTRTTSNNNNETTTTIGSSSSDDEEIIVLKTPKFNDGGYDKHNIYSAWMDTMIMERTSFSPYVLDIYGNCGVAQLTAYGTGGNLHDLIKLRRQQDRTSKKWKQQQQLELEQQQRQQAVDITIGDWMTSLDKLKVGYQLAAGLAAIQSFDPQPTIAHNDICCHQYILVNGVYTLNDFHLGSLITKNRYTNEVCQDSNWRPNKKYLKLRPPEEVYLARPPNGGGGGEIGGSTNILVNRDKTDVWLLGNVLYYVLTKRWVFEGATQVYAINQVQQGRRSPFPKELFNQTMSSVEDQALLKAVFMAWTQHPKERPSAQSIANSLEQVLLDVHDGIPPKDRVWRVSVPPLPKDYQYDTNDFNAVGNYHLDP